METPTARIMRKEETPDLTSSQQSRDTTLDEFIQFLSSSLDTLSKDSLFDELYDTDIDSCAIPTDDRSLSDCSVKQEYTPEPPSYAEHMFQQMFTPQVFVPSTEPSTSPHYHPYRGCYVPLHNNQYSTTQKHTAMGRYSTGGLSK